MINGMIFIDGSFLKTSKYFSRSRGRGVVASHKKKYELEDIVNVAAKNGIRVGILTEGDFEREIIFGNLFPESKFLIVAPSDILGGFYMDDPNLYHAIRQYFSRVSDPSIQCSQFCFVGSKKRLAAAEKAGFDTISFKENEKQDKLDKKIIEKIVEFATKREDNLEAREYLSSKTKRKSKLKDYYGNL